MFKRIEWLTVPVWLKRPEVEWPDEVNPQFASDEENTPSLVFLMQAEERKMVFQWEPFNQFNGQVNTVAYVQRALSKYKPATLVVSNEEREKLKQSPSSYYYENSLVKNWNMGKLKKKFQKAAKSYNSHPS